MKRDWTGVALTGPQEAQRLVECSIVIMTGRHLMVWHFIGVSGYIFYIPSYFYEARGDTMKIAHNSADFSSCHSVLSLPHQPIIPSFMAPCFQCLAPPVEPAHRTQLATIMAEQGPIVPLVKEETARLKWFEAFMGRRCLVLFLPPCNFY